MSMEKVTVSDIDIEVERKNIKHIHLAVYPPDARVHISAPEFMTLESLQLYAIDHLVWIRQAIARINSTERQSDRIYVSGEDHYYMGRRYLLKVHEKGFGPTVKISGRYINLFVKYGADKVYLANAMKEWYRAKLMHLLDTLVPKWEEKMGLKSGGFTIREMKTRWGSCNQRTHKLLFNLELAKKPKSCIEYVVVHELAHIVSKNHDAQFRAVLDRHMPMWEKYRDELNEFIL